MRADELRQDVEALQRQVEESQRRLAEVQENCIDSGGHVWGDVTFDPQYREGYTIPSDLDLGINLGVDTRVSRVHVPPETANEWVRTCDKCGTEQRTRQTKAITRPGSVPGTSATENVPVFPEKKGRRAY